MTRPRQTITVLPLAQLTAHPGNIRDDLGELDDMARSIREHGILQPLTATEHPRREDVFVLLAGHRRLGAAVLAGLTKVPVIIRHGLDDPDEQTIVMLVENTHRRELSPVERAKAYGKLNDAGLTMSEIARRVGTTPSTVSYYLNLLHLDEDTLDQVETGEIPSTEAIAEVRRKRQAARIAEGRPSRGRPHAHFGPDHRLADVVMRICDHQAGRYGAIGCGPCWESAIRADVVGQAVA